MLARVAVRNGKVLVFVVVVLALLGVRAYVGTTAGIFPVMTFARVDVVADAGDLPPDRVRVAIARPLEAALQSLQGVSGVVATSSQGSAELLVDFTPATSSKDALASVDQALSQARAEVPAARNVVAAAVNADREPIVSYALTSRELSQTVVRQIAATQIVPRLYGTPSLGRVLVNGGATAEYHVALDPARLAANGLGASDVTKALAAANDVRSAGTAQHDYQTYTILVDSGLGDRASIAKTGVPLKNGGSVSIGNLGRISLGVSPVTNQTSFGGVNAVILSAFVVPGGDSVAMARELRARIDAVVPSLPANIAVRPFWDQTTLITASQSALRDAIVIGALLAIGVIFLFLRDVRLTLVAAAIIPLAMAIALLALQLAGQTLNLMSVGGLAVAVGLIIDDAIVVIEGIARDGDIERTIGKLAGPMAASTATTVVVFLPLALLTGVTGFFFRALAFTLAASLIVSLALALFVAPTLARTLLRPGRGVLADPQGLKSTEPLGGVLQRYDAVLGWSLAHRTIVGFASVAVLVVTGGLLASLPSDFLPKLDEGQFEIAYTLPVGTSLDASNAAALQMERVVAADPAVASVAGLTGLDSNGVSPTQPNAGALRVRLRPPAQRDGYEDVAARLRDRLGDAIPAGVFDFRQILEDLIFDLSGDTAPIEITIRGDDRETVTKIAQRVSDAIAKVPGVVDAASGVTFDGPTIRIAPRAAALAALGITPADAGDALSALGHGTIATTLPGTQTLVPVRVSVAGSAPSLESFSPSAPLNVAGAAPTIGGVASSSTQRLATDIFTLDGQLIDRVTAGTQGASLSSVTAGLQHALASIRLPAGYSAEIGGQARSQAQSFREFLNVIALAIVLVYAVMLAAFRSFRIPLVILTAVPLALIGVALGLFVTRTAFNVSSFMGLLLLVGIVVKNGILLIDVANRRRDAGDGVREALLAAGNARLRPILMTTLAAIGGLLPLAFGVGQGSEMEKPLAIAVIGGLSTATVFTLVVIPVIYAAFAGRGAFVPVRAGAALVLSLAVCLSSFASPHAAIAATRGAQTAPSDEMTMQSDATAFRPLVFSTLSLEAATMAALASSPDVLAARAGLAESRAALDSARASSAPSIVANYAQIPQGNPPGPNVISRQVSTVLQFSLNDLVAFSPVVRTAALSYSAAQADERAAELSQRIAVAALYYGALKARETSRAAQDSLAFAFSQRDAARVRYESGDAAKLDEMRAGVEVAKAQAAAELAAAADANATEALAVETGVTASSLQATAAGIGADPDPTLDDPARAAARARATRPEIASARLLADAAAAGIAEARAGTLPTITFGGGYLTGTDSGVSVNAPTIVANLTLPFGGGTRGRVAAADARTLAARAKASAVERKILTDVAASARTLAATERADKATVRERNVARAELAATEIGYRSGASSSLELSAARSAYERAVVDELATRYDLEEARETLLLETGS